MSLANNLICTIDRYLQGTYYIPNYQREYSWEESELIDMWDDLQNILKDKESPTITHFFGQIVVHDDHNTRKKYIIDGQQRTITSIIFLRALQLAFVNVYNDYKIEDANTYNSQISFKYMNDINECKFTLGEVDGEYFRKYVQKGTLEECPVDKVKSHERLRKAFQFFTNKIEGELQSANTGQEKLDRLVSIFKVFVDRFEVLYIEATELSEAFIIFETLNARGKNLETADLLKNYIFSRSNDINIAQVKWREMLDNLDKADATKYIRHYWNSCHAFTREKELYKIISKLATTPKECVELLDNLNKFSSFYHDLAYPSDEMIGFKSSGNIEANLLILKTLKASTYYPIILAMLGKDNLNDTKSIGKVLDVIVIYVFRNFTICNKVANSAEVFFARTANEIYDEKLTTPEQIVDAIKKEIVDDEEFSTSFSLWAASNSAKEIVRYILRKIHYYYDDRKELNVNNMEVHIEHIMPQDSAKWHIDEETHEKYLWRLGNLALLSGPKNESISNKPFTEKREEYSKSEICPNKDIANNETWGVEEIETRQAGFAKIAKEIWKK